MRASAAVPSDHERARTTSKDVIHIASTHPPFDTRIFHKECRTLADAGYRVTLLVPHTHDEVVDGVQIQAVPLPESGKDRLRKTLGQLYRAALAHPPDALFHFHDSELLFHMLRLKRQGRRVVYDMHEDTPKQVRYQHWIPAAARPLVAQGMRAAEAYGARRFDGLIAAEPVIYDRFPKARRVLVHNFPIAGELVSADAAPYATRPPRIAYVGGLTEARGVREMVQTMAHLPPRLGAELVLGGTFHPAALNAEVRALPGAERVRLLGWLDRDRVAEVLATARVGLVLLHPVPRYRENYPTKLFEYMAAGLPLVAPDFPNVRPFVEATGCGLLIDPMDPAAVAAAVQYLLEHPAEAEAMGQRGQAAIRAHYNWAHEAERLLAFYEALLG